MLPKTHFRPVVIWFSVLLTVIALMKTSFPASALYDNCFVNGTGGSWTLSSTWSCGHVPNETDSVYIGYGQTVSDGGGNVRFLTVYNGGTLNQWGDFRVYGGVDLQNGATYSGSGYFYMVGTDTYGRYLSFYNSTVGWPRVYVGYFNGSYAYVSFYGRVYSITMNANGSDSLHKSTVTQVGTAYFGNNVDVPSFTQYNSNSNTIVIPSGYGLVFNNSGNPDGVNINYSTIENYGVFFPPQTTNVYLGDVYNGPGATMHLYYAQNVTINSNYGPYYSNISNSGTMHLPCNFNAIGNFYNSGTLNGCDSDNSTATFSGSLYNYGGTVNFKKSSFTITGSFESTGSLYDYYTNPVVTHRVAGDLRIDSYPNRNDNTTWEFTSYGDQVLSSANTYFMLPKVVVNKPSGSLLQYKTTFVKSLDIRSGGWVLGDWNLSGSDYGSFPLTMSGGLLKFNTDWELSYASPINLTGGTIEYAGSSYQKIKAINYQGLTLSGSGTKAFYAYQTVNVAGALSMYGNSTSNRLLLRSSSSGSPWYINPYGSRSLAYLNVQDSYNQGATIVASGTGSYNAGNNTNWNFSTRLTTAAYSGNTGSGTYSPQDTNKVYDDGTQVTLSATPAAGSRFAGFWVTSTFSGSTAYKPGDAGVTLNGSTYSYTLTMDADKTVSVVFDKAGECYVSQGYASTTPGYGVTRFASVQAAINAGASSCANARVSIPAGTYSETLTINQPVTLVPATGTTLNGSITHSQGTLQAPAAGTLAITGNYALSGTGIFEASGSTLTLNGNINYTGGEFRPGVDSLVKFNGNTTITATQPLSLFHVNILSSKTLVAPSGAALNVAGNWTNAGSFTHSSGTVVFNGADPQLISGDNTFYNFSKTTGPALIFQAGRTQVVAGTLTLSGKNVSDTITRLALRSATPGAQWTLNAQGTRTLQYLDVRDSNASNSLAILAPLAAPGLNLNGGNNTNWLFEDTVVMGVTVPTAKTYKAGETLSFSITWNNPVVVTGTPELALTIGSSARSAVYTSGSGSSTLVFGYSAASPDEDADGIAVGALSGTIKDKGDRSAALILTGKVPDTGNVRVDAVAPAIGTSGSTIPSNRTYGLGEVLDFNLNFGETVLVTGTPRLALAIHPTSGGSDVTRYATYLQGNNTDTLTFRYAVTAADKDQDGIGLPASVDLNSGTIKDLAGNAASPLTLPSFTPTPDINADGTGPVINTVTVSSTLTEPATAYGIGTELQFKVTWNNAVTVSGSPRLKLTVGSATRYAAYDSGSGSVDTIFKYIVLENDSDVDGVKVELLELNGGSIIDAAIGNAANLDGALYQSTANVDGVRSTVNSVSWPNGGTYGTGAAVDFTVTWNKTITAVTSGGTPSLQFYIGTNLRSAALVSGSGTANLVFRYIVKGAPDPDPDSGSLGSASNSLVLNGGTLKDAVGNDASLQLAASTVSVASLDNSFSGDGIVKTADNWNDCRVIRSVRTSDGKIVMAGYQESDTRSVCLMRYNSDGTIDGTFGSSGGKYHQISSSPSVSVASIALSMDESQIWVGGRWDGQGGFMRFSANGNNLLGTNSYSYYESVDALVAAHLSTNVQFAADGFWVMSNRAGGVGAYMEFYLDNTTYFGYNSGGSASMIATNLKIYDAAKTLDNYFVVVGKDLASGKGVLYRWRGSNYPTQSDKGYGIFENADTDADNNKFNSVGIRSDDTLIALNRYKTYQITRDGALVTSYGSGHSPYPSGGLEYLPEMCSGDDYYHIAITSDNKAIVACKDYSTGNLLQVTRINANGSADTSFGTGGVAKFNLGFTDFNVRDIYVQSDDKVLISGNRTSGNSGGFIVRVGGMPWVDTTAPTVTGVDVPDDKHYKEGDTLTFRLHWSEEVVVTGTPLLGLTIGSASVNASYLAGSSTTTASVFTYTVLAGQTDSDGIALAASLSLNGGTIADQASPANNASLTLANVGATDGVLVDTTAPTVSKVERVSASPTLLSGVQFKVTFSEAVTGVTTDSFSVDSTGLTGSATIASVITTSATVYQVNVSGYTGSGTLGIALKASSGVTDMASNAASNTTPATNQQYDIDNTPPGVTSVSVPAAKPADEAYLQGSTLTFTLNFGENVTLTQASANQACLAITIGSRSRCASNATDGATSAATSLEFSYNVQAEDIATGLTVDVLLLNGASLQDVVGNPALLALNSIGSASGVVIKGSYTLTLLRAGSGSGNVIDPLNSDAAYADITFYPSASSTGIQLAGTVGDINQMLFAGWVVQKAGGTGSAVSTTPLNQTMDWDYTITAAFEVKGTAYVDPNYDESTPGWGVTRFKTISGAVSGAFGGTRITVVPGTYLEDITLGGNDELTLAFADGVTINGNLTQTKNTIEAPAGTLTINGSFSYNLGALDTGVFNANGGTVKFTGSSPTISGSPAFSSLEVDVSGTLTASAALDISGTLTLTNGGFSPATGTSLHHVSIGSGTTLTAPLDGDLTVSGDWTNNGTFVPNGSMVTFNGTQAQKIQGSHATSFTNLVMNGYSVVATTALSVANQLNLQAGDFQPFDGSSIQDVVIGAVAVLKGPADNGGNPGVLSVNGNWTNQNTSGNGFVAGNSQVKFSGAGTHTLSGKTSFNALDLGTGVSLQLAANAYLGLSSDLTGAGTLDCSTNQPNTLAIEGTGVDLTSGLTIDHLVIKSGASLNGPAALTVLGNWTDQNASSSGFVPGTGTVTFSGDGVTHQLSGPTAFYNAVIGDGSILEMAQDAVLSLSHSLTTAGTGALDATTNRPNTLAIAGTNVTLPDPVTVDHLVINSGASLVAPASLTVFGDWENKNSNGSGFSAGSGTVTFDGGSVHALKGTTSFNNLLVENGSTLRPAADANLRLAGDLSMNGTGAYDAKTNSPNTLTITGGDSHLADNMLLDNLVIASGATLTAPNGSLTLVGNWTNSGTFVPGTGSVRFDGSGIQVLTGNTSFNDLTIGKDAVLQPAAGVNLSLGGSMIAETGGTGGTYDASNTPNTLTATGSSVSLPSGMTLDSLVIASGAGLNGPAELNIAGNWTNQNTDGSGFVPGSGKVTFTGPAAHLLSGTTAFNNVDVTDSTLRMAADANLKLGGSLTFNGTGALDASTNKPNTLTVTGSSVGLPAAVTLDHLVINQNATLNAPAALTLLGDLTNDGSFNAGTGAVTFAGGITQTIGGTSATTFNNLNVEKNGSNSTALVFNAGTPAPSVGGTLTLNGGSFTPPADTILKNLVLGSGGTLTAPSGTLNVTGDWTNNGGTFTPGSGKVLFNGSGDQVIKGSAATTFYDLEMDKASGVLSGTTALTSTNQLTLTAGSFAPAHGSVFKNVAIASGATLDGSNGSLTVNGSWVNDGSFTSGSCVTCTVIFNGGGTQTVSGAHSTHFNNLTVQNGSAVDFGAGTPAPEVNGLLDLVSGSIAPPAGTKLHDVKLEAAGDLAAPAGSLYVAGNWENNSSPNGFSANGGTVIFNGLDDQTIFGSTLTPFAALTVDMASGKTLTATTALTTSGAVTVNSGTFDPATGSTLNSLAVQSGGAFKMTGTEAVAVTNGVENAGTFNMSGGTLTVGGSFSNSGQYSSSGGTVNLATGNFTNSGTYDPSGGTLNLTSGSFSNSGAFNASGSSIVNLGGAFTNTSIGTFGATGGQLNLAGDLVNQNATVGAFSPTGGTITLNGSSPQQIIGSAISFASLVLNNTSGTPVSAAQSFEIKDNFDLRSGSFNPPSPTQFGDLTIDSGTSLIFDNGDAIRISGTLTNNGTFTPRNSTVTFNGDAAQEIKGSSPITMRYLVIENSAAAPVGVTAKKAITITGSLTIEKGIFYPFDGSQFNSVTIGSQGQLGLTDPNTITIYNDLVNNGSFAPEGGTLQLWGSFTNNGRFEATGGSLEVGGSFTNAASATFAAQAGSVSVIGDFTNAGEFAAVGGSLSLGANLVNTGTFHAAGGTVSFDGSAAQTITGNAPIFADLALNSSAGLSTALPITVNGAFALNAGSFNPANNTQLNDVAIASGATLALDPTDTLKISGDLTTNGTFTPNGSTLVLNGSGAQTISGSSPLTLSNLRIDKDNPTDQVTFSQALTVTNTLEVNQGNFLPKANSDFNNVTIGAQGKLTAPSGSLNVGGNWTDNNPAGGLTAGTGTVVFDGTGTQSFSGGSTFNNLTINSGATLQLAQNANLGLAGSLTLNGQLDTSTHQPNTLTLSGTGSPVLPAGTQLSNLVIGSGVTFNAPSSLLLSGSLTNNGSFAAGSGTLTLNGGGAQTIGGTNPVELYNLVVNNSGSAPVTTTQALSVANNLTVTDGTFKPADGSSFKNVSIGANGVLDGSAGTLHVSGDWSNLGGFTAGSGEVVFDGTPTPLAHNFSGSTDFHNLTLATGSTLVMAENANLGLAGALSLTDPAQLDASTHQPNTLTLNGGGTPQTLPSGLQLSNLAVGQNAVFNPPAELSLFGSLMNNGVYNPGTGTLTLNGSGAQSIGGSSPVELYNLVVNNTGSTTITTSQALTVTNALTLTDGTLKPAAGSSFNDITIGQDGVLDGSAGNLVVLGDWTNNGDFNAGTGTVTFNGGATQTVGGSASTHFNDLVVSNASAVVFGSSTPAPEVTGWLNIANGSFTPPDGTQLHDVTLGTNGSLVAPVGNLNVSGDWSDLHTSGSGLLAGTGTVTFNGSGVQNLSGASVFNNLVMGQGSILTLAQNANLGLTGDLTATGTPPGTLDALAHSGTTVSFLGSGTPQTVPSGLELNNLVIGPNAVLQGPASLFVAGNWTNNHGADGFSSNNGTVTFNGDGNSQTIGGTGPTNFASLVIDNLGGTVTAEQPITTSAALNITNGTFDPANLSTFASVLVGAGGTLTQTQGETVTITGDLTNNGTLNPSGGTLDIGGNLTNTGTLAPSGGDINLAGSLTNSGTIAPSGGTLDISGNLTNLAGGSIEPSGGSITVTGDLTNSGSLAPTGGTLNVGGDLTNNAGGSVSPEGGTLNITGDLVNNGTVDPSGGTINLSGDLTNNGTYTATGTSELNLVGPDPQVIGGSEPVTVVDLTVTSPGGVVETVPVTSTGTTEVATSLVVDQGSSFNNLTVDPTAAVTPAPGSSGLQVDGSFNNQGTVQYISLLTDTSGNGSGAVSSSKSENRFVAGQEVEVTLTATPGPNTVFIGWSGGVTSTDPQITIKFSTDQNIIAVFASLADLKVEMAVAAYPARDLTLRITVTNTGPGPADGAVFKDSFADNFTNITWTCTTTGGAACGSSGSGNLLDTIVTFPSGSQVVYEVRAVMLTRAFTNDSEVVPFYAIADTNPANNKATVTVNNYQYLLPIVTK